MARSANQRCDATADWCGDWDFTRAKSPSRNSNNSLTPPRSGVSCRNRQITWRYIVLDALILSVISVPNRWGCLQNTISPDLKIGPWETKLLQSFASTVNRQFKGIFLAVKIH